ncbi:MAG: phage virion morphogenesis protein [Polaromonas sp.]|nr:phage virion morphogenesis protein [Polaromonas sp.]
MTTFTIEVHDESLRNVLKALQARMGNLAPVLTALGDSITERTKQRFDTSTAPDGTPWTPNSAATLGMLSARLAGSKGNVKKSGGLNARGNAKLANKKPLIDSGFLREQIVPVVSGQTLTVSATAKYAAIHQFGGQAGRGRKVTIPARPFLPLQPNGALYPQERQLVLDALNDFLMDGL